LFHSLEGTTDPARNEENNQSGDDDDDDRTDADPHLDGRQGAIDGGHRHRQAQHGIDRGCSRGCMAYGNGDIEHRLVEGPAEAQRLPVPPANAVTISGRFR